MSIMEVDGYKARIQYDPELNLFRGEILGLNGSADFYGDNPASLREEFKNSLKVFLEVCKEKGISPTNGTQTKTGVKLGYNRCKTFVLGLCCSDERDNRRSFLSRS